jgi:hypothetical protein
MEAKVTGTINDEPQHLNLIQLLCREVAAPIAIHKSKMGLNLIAADRLRRDFLFLIKVIIWALNSFVALKLAGGWWKRNKRAESIAMDCDMERADNFNMSALGKQSCDDV